MVNDNVSCGDYCIGTNGWYYRDLNHRSAAWTLVERLKNFIVDETQTWSGGPEGCLTTISNWYLGDGIQYEKVGDPDTDWDHSVIITDLIDMGNGEMFPLVASHTPDLLDYPYNQIIAATHRYIHIERVDDLSIHLPLILGTDYYSKISTSAYPAPATSTDNLWFSAYPSP